MMPRQSEFFIDTDVLGGYLMHEGDGASALRRLLAAGKCYTSVLNAAELLAAARGGSEMRAVMNLLGGLYVLGFHQRYAETFGEIYRGCAEREKRGRMRISMIAGVCIANKLPLVTSNMAEYAGIASLELISAKDPAHG
jgi:predicted nucleic acid-binding protein